MDPYPKTIGSYIDPYPKHVGPLPENISTYPKEVGGLKRGSLCGVAVGVRGEGAKIACCDSEVW